MRKRRLLWLLLLLGVALGTAGFTYWPTPRRQALARIQALHGTYLEQIDPDGGERWVNVVVLMLRPVTEQDLAALRDLRPLHRLILDGSPVTDAGLASLGDLPELELLTLSGTKVTDAGLTHLGELKRLKRLVLAGTGVTDKGLVHFRQLTGLRDLNLVETRVTERGAQELQQVLPNLQISLHLPKDDE
jgi:hypothetical protein